MNTLKRSYLDEDYFRDLNEPKGPEVPNEIGYPVHVYFHELSKLYMQSIPWNWHPDVEIIIINHGDVIFMTNDKKTELHAGQGVIINANVIHSVVPAGEDANCSMYSTTFDPAFLFGYGDVLIADKYLVPVINSRSFQFMKLDEDVDVESKLLTDINSVIACNLVKSFGYELTTKARLCEFWLTLLGIISPGPSAKSSSHAVPLDEQRTKEIIHYIKEHYAEKVTLDDLASSVHISKSECCRCFKRTLNLTPIEYLMRYRIYRAASLIQSRDPQAASFSELAYNVGFNNASYFNKVFRQYLSCTPSEYKKRLKQDPSFDLFSSISL
ncbi:MAG: AraC family transcriptional regulator [Lachnospiraceae bacterium]|nr:AraC family transcriptional regulator [Lachnospiraceae bacterium]